MTFRCFSRVRACSIPLRAITRRGMFTAFYTIGSNFEDAQWNHFLGKVSSLCKVGFERSVQQRPMFWSHSPFSSPPCSGWVQVALRAWRSDNVGASKRLS
jgi:hypothetical protein